jgi:alkanesulfonate monooxygenase SsuD/methylene tetrahydromethanopterin reductase-like flavin-dependent oxidoreductase (luciferase family)
MDLAVVLRPTLPPERLVEQAQAAEAAGARELWLWEDCFLTGGIAATAAALAATERIVVGIGILPAPVRNAAFAAMELATLARLHPGRLHAGFGHGIAEWMRQVGAKPASQLTLLEEVTVAVRALLRGETVDTEGRYVRLRGVALDHPPATVPPVSLGVHGPKSLRLSGRCADGTVLGAPTEPDDAAAARRAIDEGRSEAGRTDPHRLTVLAEPGADRDAYAAAGVDCLAFQSPDEHVPLDLTQVFVTSRPAGAERPRHCSR